MNKKVKRLFEGLVKYPTKDDFSDSKIDKIRSQEEINIKHKKDINELYKEHGVGRTIKQRLAYWEGTCPGGYSISTFPSHKISDKRKVTIFEETYCSDTFPEDYIYV